MAVMKKNPKKKINELFAWQQRALIFFHLVLEMYFTGSFKIKCTNIIIQTIMVFKEPLELYCLVIKL